MSAIDPPPGKEPAPAYGPPAGLCATCAHQRLIRNTRGSAFSMCERWKTDERYPRYPRIPVLRCAGHEPRPEGTPAPEGPANPRPPSTGSDPL